MMDGTADRAWGPFRQTGGQNSCLPVQKGLVELLIMCVALLVSVIAFAVNSPGVIQRAFRLPEGSNPVLQTEEIFRLSLRLFLLLQKGILLLSDVRKQSVLFAAAAQNFLSFAKLMLCLRCCGRQLLQIPVQLLQRCLFFFQFVIPRQFGFQSGNAILHGVCSVGFDQSFRQTLFPPVGFFLQALPVAQAVYIVLQLFQQFPEPLFFGVKNFQFAVQAFLLCGGAFKTSAQGTKRIQPLCNLCVQGLRGVLRLCVLREPGFVLCGFETERVPSGIVR